MTQTSQGDASPDGFFASPALRRVAAVALILGLVLRAAPLLADPGRPLEGCDGLAYWDLAQSVAAGDGFVQADERLLERCSGFELGPSHHYSPVLPVLESVGILVAGASEWTLAVVLVMLSWATVAVAYATTRERFGPDAALLVAGAVSVEWTGVFFGTHSGYAENLVLLTLIVTFWAILKSLEDERWIVVAGAGAGIGYLSKASVGWFFLLAGLGGLAWRVAYKGRQVLGDRWYGLAILVFGVLAGAWALRNLTLFWDGTWAGLWTAWQTSAYTAQVVENAVTTPLGLAGGLAAKFPILVLGLAACAGPVAAAWRPSLVRWREESVSVLWLGAGLVFALGLLFSAAFWLEEGSRALWPDPIRYIVPAQVPLLWLAVNHHAPRPQAWAWGLLYATNVTLILVLPGLMAEGGALGMCAQGAPPTC